MIKKICGILITSSAILNGASYKSTEAALADINDTYDFLLSSDNIYTTPKLLQDLRTLGDKVNSYITHKQGLLLGKATPKNPSAGPLVLGDSNNFFDIWDYIFETFNTLTETLQKIRLSSKDTLSKSPYALRSLQLELNSDAWQELGINRVNKIPTDDLRGQKKKIASLIRTFSENNIQLIKKAQRDIESYLTRNK